MFCPTRLIAAAILGVFLCAAAGVADDTGTVPQQMKATIKVNKVVSAKVGGGFSLEVEWGNCPNTIDSVRVDATDASGAVIGGGSVATQAVSAKAINFMVTTSAMAGDTVTFQAFARDATPANIVNEQAPFKTGVAK